MNKVEEFILKGEFVGIVEDNNDPDKKQRVKIRIPYLHGDKNAIPTDHLPWCQPKRSNNGLSFMIPDKGKVINVTFPSGNLYYPVYDNAQHLNVNLQKKIEKYSGDDYTGFVALIYNHNAQFFLDTDGFNMRFHDQLINLHNGGIVLKLADNSSKLMVGDNNADQEMMLGTHFMEWFDTLVTTLFNPYLGNIGAPVIPNPQMINVLNQYNALRSTFVSKHVYVVDNLSVQTDKLDVSNQIGDAIKQTNHEKELTIKNDPIDFAALRKDVSDHISDELNHNTKSVDLDTPITEVKVTTNDSNSVVNQDQNLSKYVTLKMAIHSAKAIALKVDNSPTDEHIENMKHAATEIFDKCYDYMLANFGVKIKVNSFYRSATLNSATTGASKTSQHMTGQAIDIHAGKFNKQLFKYIKENLTYDQIIWEFGSKENPNWVHASFSKNSPNRKKNTRALASGEYIGFDLDLT